MFQGILKGFDPTKFTAKQFIRDNDYVEKILTYQMRGIENERIREILLLTPSEFDRLLQLVIDTTWK